MRVVKGATMLIWPMGFAVGLLLRVVLDLFSSLSLTPECTASLSNPSLDCDVGLSKLVLVTVKWREYFDGSPRLLNLMVSKWCQVNTRGSSVPGKSGFRPMSCAHSTSVDIWKHNKRKLLLKLNISENWPKLVLTFILL